MTWPRAETLLIAALVLLLAGTYLVARDSGPLQAVEGVALDQRFALRGPVAAAREVAIVAIDEESLSQLGRWPVSRSVLAEAVRRIDAAGASAIVFDLLLVGRESEAADVALAAALAEAGNAVVAYAFVLNGPVRDREPDPAIAESAYRVVLTGAAPDAIPQARTVLAPQPDFMASAAPAHASVLLSGDGHLRFAHPAIGYREGLYPSLAVTAARLHRGLSPSQLAVERGVGLRLGEARFGTGADLAQAINFAGPTGTFPTWSLAELVAGRVPPAGLAGRVVLIGATASGLGDRFVTSYDANLPGVEVFANVIDNLLRDRFLRRDAMVEALDLGALLLAGIAAAALGAIAAGPLLIAGAVALLAAWCATCLAGFALGHLWLNFTLPALAIVLGTAIVVAGRGLREGRQRRRLSRFVSPLATRRRLHGATHDQVAAVMFVDLVGFTHVGETLPPAELAETMRGFHRRVERAATACGGLVDKYIGDAVLVVFGLAAGRESAARDALDGARAVVAAIADWNAERRRLGQPAIDCGVGLHVGPVRVAEVGGADHAQITVTGDTVNVASRLEALTRELRTTVIASDALIDAARAAGAAPADFAALPPQAIRGRAQPVGVWAWAGPA